MVNYKCPRCGYEINIKTKYMNHLRRKNLCKPKVSNCDLQSEYIKYDISDKIISSVDYSKNTANHCKNTANHCKNTVNYCKSIDLDESSIENSDDSFEIEIDNKNNLICQYCNKTFTRKENLENHLKKSCKMLKDFNNIYEYDEKTFGKNIYKDSNNAGDIYIVQTDYINDDHYKIGITNNIKKRMASYRCGNTYEPRLHYYISCKDVKLIDNKIKIDLVKYNVKREIFKGDVIEIKNKIVEVIKKEFKINKVYVHEPDIKIGDLSECGYCNKCFYTKNDLFDHINTCEEYKEYLSKKKEGNYECEYCKKNYSRIDSLNRHLKTCKEKKKDVEEKTNLLNIVNMLNEQLKEQKEQNKEQQKQINELIKKAGMTIGTQNIQQNIKILAYNNTDISHLTDKDYLKCLKHSNFCIPHLIEQIHFNPQKPENHNIYISNLKNNYVMIYNGNKWMLNDREESIQNLIDDKESMIEQKLEEWVENGKQYPDIMRKFNRYLEKKENDKVINKVKDEIKLMLFNNRDVVSL
tara:strand:+ start:183 stop:1751 length:1569 start_codon:yes stop_codon:yes gene_type:complete